MIKETLSRLEAAIRTIETVDPVKKAELLKLYASLQSEIAAYEAARTSKSGELLKSSVEGLQASVKEFELSHPQLVDSVNDLCVLLARMGI